jgi:hypothetical protein
VTAPLVHAERTGAVDVLVLDSQHNRNAMSIRLLEELLEHVGCSAAGDGRALVLDHHQISCVSGFVGWRAWLSAYLGQVEQLMPDQPSCRLPRCPGFGSWSACPLSVGQRRILALREQSHPFRSDASGPIEKRFDAVA